MAVNKRKRTQSAEAAANTSKIIAPATANTTGRKTSRQRPPPNFNHQSPRTTNALEIRSSPPESAQPAGQPLSPSPSPPNLPETFKYWVLQTAVTTPGACIWSKRVGPFTKDLCASPLIQRDILDGIQHTLGVTVWEVILKMAWVGGRKKATSESCSINDLPEDWISVEEVLQLQIQRGLWARDIKKGVHPTIEVVFTVRKLSTSREDQEAIRTRERQQQRSTSTQSTQQSQNRSIPTPVATPTPAPASVTARREAAAPEVLEEQLRLGQLGGIVSRQYLCRKEGCSNKTRFCFPQDGDHYRLERNQLIT